MKQTIFASLFLTFLLIFGLVMVYAENNVEPSNPNSITYVGNSTNNYTHGTMLNYSRGHIHTITITETQPTFKWIGYVGNISGSYALQDAFGYALYDWSIATTTGEIYATKEGSGTDVAGTPDGDQGGIPHWENITCANAANVTQEEILFNHTIARGASADEDSYTNTFTTSFTLNQNFFVGQEVEITGAGCYGVNLNMNGTSQSAFWDQVVLMDGTLEDEGPGGTDFRLQWDIIYAARIENNSYGYDNGSTYDFQLLLPQSGLEGSSVANTAYYFYVELI